MHSHHPKAVISHDIWVLFAKRGGIVRGERPTKTCLCYKTSISHLSCRSHFLFSRKCSSWCRSLLLVARKYDWQSFLPRTRSSRASDKQGLLPMPLPPHYSFHLFWWDHPQHPLWSMILFTRWAFHSELRQAEKNVLRKAKSTHMAPKPSYIPWTHHSKRKLTHQVSTQGPDACTACGSRLT